MKPKKLFLAAVGAMSLMAFTSSSASATTLELNGVTQNQPVLIEATITSGNSAVLSKTSGDLGNFCTSSTIAGSTSVYTGTKVTGALGTMGLLGCLYSITVHKKGQLYIEHEAGSTGGVVYSENAEVTSGTAFGFTVNCKTESGTKVGTLNGVAAGRQTFVLNAVLNCGFLLPSATYKGTYTVTTEGLGVSA